MSRLIGIWTCSCCWHRNTYEDSPDGECENCGFDNQPPEPAPAGRPACLCETEVPEIGCPVHDPDLPF